MNHVSPVALFVFNRPEHTLKTLYALMDNTLAKETPVYIFSDGFPKNTSLHEKKKINTVRRLIKGKTNFFKVEIIEQKNNKGLADSIVGGINYVLEKHDRVIVLEDDIVTSPHFLSYMNRSLLLYENEEQVMHIAGYLPYYPANFLLRRPFLSQHMSCWGWATWKRAWEKSIWDPCYLYSIIESNLYQFNLDGVLDYHLQLESNLRGMMKTWAIKWYSSIFIHKGLCLYPHIPLVKNIGIDGTGIHSGWDHAKKFDTPISNKPLSTGKVKIKESRLGKYYLQYFYKYGKKIRLKNFIFLNKPSEKYLDSLKKRKIYLNRNFPVEKVGTSYGFAVVPKELLNSGSVVYSFGAGLDLCFDIDIVRKFGCKVHIFDPTPGAVEHFETLSENVHGDKDFLTSEGVPYNVNKTILKELDFFDLALWNEDKTVKFFLPTNEAHISHSITNIQNTEEFIEVKANRLLTIMKKFNHRKIDFLKLDIEGAEYSVIDDIIDCQLDISAMYIEYHFSAEKSRTENINQIEESIAKIKTNGYQIIYSNSYKNFTFLKNF